MVMRRTPRPSVEPLDSILRLVGAFLVQQNQLLLSAYGNSFQPFLYVADSGLRVGQGNNQDAISLANATLRPRRQGVVALVKNDAVLVLLLS